MCVWKFLESEMLVMLGLTEDADRTDSEIADIFNLKKGTVSSVRRRLLDAGAIQYVNVPSLNKLGCELIGAHIGSTEPSTRADQRIIHYQEFCSKTPQIFHAMMGGGSVALFSAFRNATEYDGFVTLHNHFFSGSRRSSKARLMSCMFPFTLTKMSEAPSFAGIVYRHFGLDVPSPRVRPLLSHDVESPDLTGTEKQTMVHMVENPDCSDREIAAKVGLSRQAITRIRNKFTDSNLIRRVCMPRLLKWGFELIATSHSRFNMEVSWEKRLKSQPKEIADLSFFTLSKADEAVTNHALARFADYSNDLEGTLAWYHKMKALDEDPGITLFSLDRCTELRVFDYGPAVRNLLLK